MDKQFSRIEAKLDALLSKAGIKPESVVPVAPAPAAPRKLTAAEQQAIDNAPKVAPVVGPHSPAPVAPVAPPTPPVVEVKPPERRSERRET